MTTTQNRPDDRRVCILGMGFVGVTLAAVMAEVGFEVFGVDIRRDLVENLNAGEAQFFERGLTEKLKAGVHAGRLRAFERIPEDCPATVYIITVGTPLDGNGRADLNSIRTASREIAAHLRDGDLVVVRSTVGLRTTTGIVKPILAASGRQFDLVFCPERTVEGNAMTELRVLPQLVGAETPQAGLRASNLFQAMTRMVVRVSDIETAELIKLLDNTTRDVMFAYANEVAMICDAVGISAEEVIRSGRLGYSRSWIPQPGPVGGPCLSKDPDILCESLEPYGIDPQLTRIARRFNQAFPAKIGREIAGLASKIAEFRTNPEVAILGIAFKGEPPTDDIRGTTVPGLIDGLRSALPDARLRGYDPLVDQVSISSFGLEPIGSLERAFDGADLVVIHTNHPAFAQMPLGALAQRMRTPGIIYDLWNLFSESGAILPQGLRYIAIGSHVRPVLGTL
jgi:nucleotide sugar dehydrogenase